MQRVGSDPTCSGTPSLITRDRIVQRTDRHPERARLGVRDSSTTKFQGLIIISETRRQPLRLSPDSPTPVRRRSMPFGAGITDLKSDQSVDSVISAQFPDTSQRSVLEMSEVPRICIARSPIGAVDNIFARHSLGHGSIPENCLLSAVKRLSRETPRGRTSPRKTAPNKLY